MRVQTPEEVAAGIADGARLLISGNGDMLLPDAVPDATPGAGTGRG